MDENNEQDNEQDKDELDSVADRMISVIEAEEELKLLCCDIGGSD